MKRFAPNSLRSVLVAAALPILAASGQHASAADRERNDRFRHSGSTRPESPSDNSDQEGRNITPEPSLGVTEAPAGFDNLTNGFDPQGPAFETLTEDNVVPTCSFNDNRFIFEEVEGIADGLGPTYNAQSCRECHQNVVTGGASQIAEKRTGRKDENLFFESLGGSLIHSRATHPDIVERVFFDDGIRTFRI